VWIKSDSIPGPYCHSTITPPPDYIIFTPIGVCQSHNVRETLSGYANYSVMYTYQRNQLRLHHYSDSECTQQTFYHPINMSDPCHYYAGQNPRYLAEFSYVRFSLSPAIYPFFSEFSYSVTTYDSTTPSCDENFLLFDLQWSPYTCMKGSHTGPYESNGKCSPFTTAVNVRIKKKKKAKSNISLHPHFSPPSHAET
jgi:hypothetical protein